MFRVWTDGRELEWAKKSWEALAKRGLASYSSQIEKTLVMIRLMTLAVIYRDFCELAFDETHEPEYTCSTNELSLSTFRVAQCLGSEFMLHEEADDRELLESALLELMETARSEIHKVLLAEFGGDSLLFVSLWNTVDYSRDDDLEPFENDGEDTEAKQDGDGRENEVRPAANVDWREFAESTLNDVTGEKEKAFNWIREGMCSVH